MLVHIAIKNLAIVKKVDLTLGNGLTAITGETGAGKSIALDALGLCLGDRAESNMVREGADKAEVIAHFDITKVPQALRLLKENELQQDDNLHECFIRRVINHEGRSKAFVNGIPVNLSQLKAIGKTLALIHGQHAHYQFLKPENQRHVLDQYAQHKPCLDAVQTTYKSFTASQRELIGLQNAQQQRLDRAQLLAYQVQELDEFSLGEHEFDQLETDFKKQNNTQDLLSNSQAALFALKDDDNANAVSLLNQSIKALGNVAQYDESVNGIIESLQGALIQAEDAANELDHYAQEIEADPAQLAELEARYTKCLDLARKHQVQPEQLFDAHLQLANEYALLTQEEDSLITLEQTVKQQLLDYQAAASALTKSRVKASKLLSSENQKHIPC